MRPVPACGRGLGFTRCCFVSRLAYSPRASVRQNIAPRRNITRKKTRLVKKIFLCGGHGVSPQAGHGAHRAKRQPRRCFVGHFQSEPSANLGRLKGRALPATSLRSASLPAFSFLHLARLIPFVKSKTICSCIQATPIAPREISFYENPIIYFCILALNHVVERVSGEHASRMGGHNQGANRYLILRSTPREAMKALIPAFQKLPGGKDAGRMSSSIIPTCSAAQSRAISRRMFNLHRSSSLEYIRQDRRTSSSSRLKSTPNREGQHFDCRQRRPESQIHKRLARPGSPGSECVDSRSKTSGGAQ